MGRSSILAFGLIAYAIFFPTFLYLFGFMSNLLVPKSIDSGRVLAPVSAIAIDVLLIGLLVVQHTIMARGWFKRWWTRIIPAAIERSTFVLVTSLIFILMFWLWRPLPTVLWQVDSGPIRTLLWCLFTSGILIVLFSSFLIDHFDLFGLRQVFLSFRNREYSPSPFMIRSLYKYVRHPLMVGFFIAMWATPTMTIGHLLFSTLMTAYIVFGTHLEENDLVRVLGTDYERYRQTTPMFIPLPPKHTAGDKTAAAENG